jgi:hypothetical protein
MGEQYPKIVIKGSKTSVTFRFPVFNDKIIYDPVASVQDYSGPTVGSSKPVPSLWATLILGVFLRLCF